MLLRRRNIPETHASLTVISGGQSGVDRAALDCALELGIAHGGWCPLGRKAEDGPIPATYCLRETSSSEYSERTLRNIQDSDGTWILHRGTLHGGTLLTHQLATAARLPVISIQLEDIVTERVVANVADWFQNNSIRVLNVAGPRESREPGIYLQTLDMLRTLLAACA